MREFDYSLVNRYRWDGEVLDLIAHIYQYKGKQELYVRQKRAELDRLVELAKIQSTESSNKIEQIGTTPIRLRQLMKDATTPRNRNEEEIIGYRDVLTRIHESYEHINLSEGVILQLHRDLLRYTPLTHKGRFKNTQNYISELLSDGSHRVIFTPLQPFETPEAIRSSCKSYNQVIQLETVNPLLLIPIFILDFLSIHPFNDGNGRMSRLLTTLLLYKSGFMVGKYISIEQQVERTKVEYYAALRESSINWASGENDYLPFIKYFLRILIRCYGELDERLEAINQAKTALELVIVAVDSTLGKFTKQEIWEICPSISRASVENSLKTLVEEGYITRLGSGPSTAYIKR